MKVRDDPVKNSSINNIFSSFWFTYRCYSNCEEFVIKCIVHCKGPQVLTSGWICRQALADMSCSADSILLAGPDVGGPYGPYRQSDRTEIYNKLVQDLMERDLVFPCFCTEEELEQSKKESEAKHLPPIYRGKWAKASKEVIRSLLSRCPQLYFRPLPHSLAAWIRAELA